MRPLAWPLLLLIGGCGQAGETARPALFVARDADTTLWLFGTVHLLPAATRWEGEKLATAMRAADELVTELPALPAGAAAAAFLKWGRAKGLPPIAARVPPAKREALRAMAERTGTPLAQLDGLKTWAAALMLGARAAGLTGADAAHGAEAVIEARFAGRPRRGLETLDAQFALFDGLSEADQQRLLAGALAGGDDYRATLNAWGTGDLAALERIVTDPRSTSPAMRDALITRRNARWATWLRQRMAAPGRVFVAVGAGHLAGPNSVIAQLRAAGIRVTRVQ